MKIVNRRAKHDYEILDTLDAGVVLSGSEVKSIRAGRASLMGAFVKIRNNEAWLINMLITKYEHAGELKTDERRTRKLLLTSKQLLDWERRSSTKGMAIVPLEAFTKKGLVKISLGLGKGKREFEKREVIKKRDIQRDVERELRGKDPTVRQRK